MIKRKRRNYPMKQVSKTARIMLNGNIEKVFPLFSPLEEKKWDNSWNPDFLYPSNGEFVENLVFKTKASDKTEKAFYWTISYLNRQDHLVIYTVFTENRVWIIKVQCVDIGKNKTEAEIKYTFTSLNEKGIAMNREALEKMYKNELKDWEAAINHFLTTGKSFNHQHHFQ